MDVTFSQSFTAMSEAKLMEDQAPPQLCPRIASLAMHTRETNQIPDHFYGLQVLAGVWLRDFTATVVFWNRESRFVNQRIATLAPRLETLSVGASSGLPPHHHMLPNRRSLRHTSGFSWIAWGMLTNSCISLQQFSLELHQLTMVQWHHASNEPEGSFDLPSMPFLDIYNAEGEVSPNVLLKKSTMHDYKLSEPGPLTATTTNISNTCTADSFSTSARHHSLYDISHLT